MAEKALSGAQHLRTHVRNPSEPTFLFKTLRSDNAGNTVVTIPPWRAREGRPTATSLTFGIAGLGLTLSLSCAFG